MRTWTPGEGCVHGEAGEAIRRVGERSETPWFWKYFPGSMCPSTLCVRVPSSKGFQQRTVEPASPSLWFFSLGLMWRVLSQKKGRENKDCTQIPTSLARLSIHAISWPAKAGDGWLVFEFREGYLYAFFCSGMYIKKVYLLFDMEIWKQHWCKCFWMVIWHLIRDKKKIKFCILTQKVGEDRCFL